MSVFLVFLNGFDMYAFTETLSNLKVWGFICGYALVTTMFIDLVQVKWIPFTFITRFRLYGFAGLIVFFPIMDFHISAFIAGSVGALCACFMHLVATFAQKKQYAWAVLLVFPLLLSIRLIDFTGKEGRHEEKKATSFSAAFERFHEKTKIRVRERLR